jgi:hypothetical protein
MQVSKPCKESVAIPVIWLILISSYLRIRRVKCDEDRPYCLRCRTFGIECDGYTLPDKSAKRLILPKRKMYLQHQVIPIPPIYVQPRGVFFESEQESRSFNVFYTKTAYQLGWTFNPDLFRISISQASVREWPIKHAVIALGALDVSQKTGATRSADSFVLLLLKRLLMTLTLPVTVRRSVVLIY